MWPNHPKAREILPDPEDESIIYSYWRDAQVGDWVRFLTHQQKIALFTVIGREDSKLRIEAKHFELDGREVPKDKPDIRSVKLDEDQMITRNSLLQNPFVVRTVYEWDLFNTDRMLYCERRTVDNPTGEDNETCYSWKIRCGGYVFQRRGNNLVVLLIDYGEAENPPKWGVHKASALLKYWYEFNRFLDQPVVAQEDPEDGELPEKPEEPPPPEIVENLKEIDKLVISELPKAAGDKRFDDAAASLDRLAELVGKVRSYAQANNFTPAIAVMKQLDAAAAEVRKACEDASDETDGSLNRLKGRVDLLFISVDYKREKKRR
jgi:hypothetical protein